jgi:hypothetical protein
MRRTGEIANEHGDIYFTNDVVWAEGRVPLPWHYAFAAMRYGWRIVGAHDEFLLVQRGGERWRSRAGLEREQRPHL